VSPSIYNPTVRFPDANPGFFHKKDFGQPAGLWSLISNESPKLLICPSSLRWMKIFVTPKPKETIAFTDMINACVERVHKDTQYSSVIHTQLLKVMNLMALQKIWCYHAYRGVYYTR